MPLSRKVKLGYGLGHVFNDLCASMWFTYLLVYLQYVLQLDRGLSGFFLMVGQIADALATPLVGIQSDRGSGFCRYGRRKSWHALGSVLVAVSFPFIFMLCRECWGYMGPLYIIMIGFMICVFQFGWASSQVSHLALIPDLTPVESEREELNLLRYIFDVGSDVLVYLVAWVVLAGDPNWDRSINPSDASSFRTITVVVMIVGIFFTIVFHALTPEPPTSAGGGVFNGAYQRTSREEREADEEEEGPGEREDTERGSADGEGEERPQMRWRDWLQNTQFYHLSVLYACARLVANLANIYMPIYLEETLHTRQELIAVVPLVMSLSGVGASFFLRLLRKGLGKKSCLVVGIVVGLLGCTISSLTWMPEWLVYITAVLWGVSGSLMVVLSLALASSLISHNVDSSAFVYGSLSFTDKIVNGVVVLIIQELTRVTCDGDNCTDYYRSVMSLGIFIPLVVAFIFVCLLSRHKFRRNRKDAQGEGDDQESSSASDSSELLLASTTNLGYGSVTKA
ncbi:hypothetical protein Pcinc_012943 [Petrolisthes cinctipes]|uniref:Major facilitator superfamily domain-containing protein 12-like n=1 Tax=Petrolisthes cinctipes TaxID=88211 RepID=A0AAE1KQW4_PETCI|nr:hypothetical protein Pcinc_012943 [Petrolisthes cinctipes]